MHGLILLQAQLNRHAEFSEVQVKPMLLRTLSLSTAMARSGLLTLGVLIAGLVVGVAVAKGMGVYVLIAIGFVLLLRWPVQLALGTFAFLTPFDDLTVLGSPGTGLTLTWFAGAGVIVILSAVGVVGKRLEWPPKSAIWWALFVLWGAITMGWAVQPEKSFERLPTALSLVVLYLVATSIRVTDKELTAIIFMTIAGGVGAATMTGSDFFSGRFLAGTTRGTLILGATESGPNLLAASLLMPFALAVGWIVDGRGTLARTAMVIAAAALAIGVLVTESRGGMFALLVTIFVFSYRLKAKLRILLVAACVALLSVMLLPDSFFARLSRNDRGAGRLDVWSAGAQALTHYAGQGAGWNNFPVVYQEFAGQAPVFHGYSRGAHNIFLGMAVEVGILGLLFLLLAVRSQLRHLGDRLLVPFEAGCWGMLAAGMFLDLVWRKTFWLAWILLAIATRVRQRAVVTEDYA
jgi:O-antigen ligase